MDLVETYYMVNVCVSTHNTVSSYRAHNSWRLVCLVFQTALPFIYHSLKYRCPIKKSDHIHTPAYVCLYLMVPRLFKNCKLHGMDASFLLTWPTIISQMFAFQIASIFVGPSSSRRITCNLMKAGDRQ